MFQRDDLAARAVGDADHPRRRGLPVQETLGPRARRRDVQIGRIGETLGRAVAILRMGDLAVLVVVVPLFAPARVGDEKPFCASVFGSLHIDTHKAKRARLFNEENHPGRPA